MKTERPRAISAAPAGSGIGRPATKAIMFEPSVPLLLTMTLVGVPGSIQME